MIFLDLAGAACSLISTYYFIRLNSRAWVVGIVATLLNGWLYWSKGIYADMTLEGCYFLSMIYVWIKWRQQDIDSTNSRPLKQLNFWQWLSLSLVFCCTLSVIYFLLITFTHSSVAFLDATTTTLSLVAQWLMCYKIIFTWILWLIADSVYSIMYLGKHLPFHSLLMLLYTTMAISGYVVWSRQLTRSQDNETR